MVDKVWDDIFHLALIDMIEDDRKSIPYWTNTMTPSQY